MKFFRITNGFDQMTDAYLLVRANFIKNSTAGNDYFPAPAPSINDLTATITAFSIAVDKAETGDKQEVAAKNGIRAFLINQLHLLGNYVLFTAAGNSVIATSSGFNISKLPQPRPAVAVPQGLLLQNGLNRGELQLKFKTVPSARAYQYEITPSPLTPNSQWEISMNTVSKKMFDGLESGKEYHCRVAAIGIKEQVVYSEVVSRIAL